MASPPPQSGVGSGLRPLPMPEMLSIVGIRSESTAIDWRAERFRRRRCWFRRRRRRRRRDGGEKTTSRGVVAVAFLLRRNANKNGDSSICLNRPTDRRKQVRFVSSAPDWPFRPPITGGVSLFSTHSSKRFNQQFKESTVRSRTKK